MFQQLRQWYGELEEEQMRVLERPELAEQLQPGFRRYCAVQLGKLSQIERQQLRTFQAKYRGRRLFIALAKWLLAFSAIGVIFHLVHPS